MRDIVRDQLHSHSSSEEWRVQWLPALYLVGSSCNDYFRLQFTYSIRPLSVCSLKAFWHHPKGQ